MTITVTGFNWVPDFARGQVRDLRRPAFRKALADQLASFDEHPPQAQ